MPSKDEILKALSTCIEPELHKDIVTLGMVQNLVVDAGVVSFDYVLTTPACPLKGMMQLEAETAVKKVPGVTAVKINMTASVKKDARLENILPPGIKNLIAVAAGKGGVGKSTIASNMACALALDGARVGLMDADIYGPNQPQMMGVSGYKPVAGADNKIEPAMNHGVKVMSMGFLMDPDAPVIWRGPMLHGAITQFLKDVKWGELDYLILDLPPGTGDVQLTLCQTVPLAGSVIVTTPQSIALSDVRKAVAMFKKLNVPILGAIENMSGFICPKCSTESKIFAEGSAAALKKNHGIDLLGSIPLDPKIGQASEDGAPLVIAHPNSAPAKALREAARRVVAQVSIRNATSKPLEIKLVKA
ncbi:MAG: Mrp/NBP35 family ATP-binding protein [Elusimicrobiota bacterium]|nr:MAG: Mrp/NBP35 family ATP-binding protein [Elusimicrobiota bacterium]